MLNKRLLIVVFNIFGFILVTGLVNNEIKTRPSDKRQDARHGLPHDLKYILLWTRSDYAPFYYLGPGQQKFFQNNCSVTNCYVTDDRNFFGGDLTKFDAVAFNGRNIDRLRVPHLPKSRSPHQIYIFFNTESSGTYPVCNPIFDGFFNWTATYRLDSDIPYPYVLIKNMDGEVVGPKVNMTWIEDMYRVDTELFNKFQNKSKVAAWFVSRCNRRIDRKRQNYVANLKKALKPYGMSVDIFGVCGTLECPRSRQSDCNKMLERDYYFYLVMENSFAEDYVSEKVVTAFQHYTLPIVFGGANYSRFLPPMSHLNARELKPKKLARVMVKLMSHQKEYIEYFRWKNHYTYHNPEAVENVCAVCAALNNRTMVEKPKSYKHFRRWWNMYFSKQCRWYT